MGKTDVLDVLRRSTVVLCRARARSIVERAMEVQGRKGALLLAHRYDLPTHTWPYNLRAYHVMTSDNRRPFALLTVLMSWPWSCWRAIVLDAVFAKRLDELAQQCIT